MIINFTLCEIDKLAGDNKRVVLVGGSGDCLNATFVDVSNTIPFPYRIDSCD